MLVLNDPSRETPGEEVTAPVVTPVEPRRVEAIEALHCGGEEGLLRPEHEVEVVREEGPRVHAPAEAEGDLAELAGPGVEVELVERDPALLDSARRDVVERRSR